MRPIDREAVILDLLGEGDGNVVDADFVTAYVEATGVPYAPQPYGASKCRTLGRDLSRMYQKGLLVRERAGLWNMGGMGFPTWVWVYRASPKEQGSQ